MVFAASASVENPRNSKISAVFDRTTTFQKMLRNARLLHRPHCPNSLIWIFLLRRIRHTCEQKINALAGEGGGLRIWLGLWGGLRMTDVTVMGWMVSSRSFGMVLSAASRNLLCERQQHGTDFHLPTWFSNNHREYASWIYSPQQWSAHLACFGTPRSMIWCFS